MSQTFLRRTPETEALQQEQAATSVMDQQAAEQDFIAKQQKEAEKAQRAAEEAANDAARAQKAQIAAAKNAGVKIQTDAATGQDTMARHEDGAPLYESGFTSEPQQGKNGPAVSYRDPRGKQYEVPVSAINRTTDPTGSPFYEFTLPTGERVRQPEDKAKPLFKVDPTTGQRYTEAPDTKTGSYTQTPLGLDRDAAAKAAIEKRKAAAKQQEDERSFKASELRLMQDQQQIALRPVKDRLDLAAEAFDKLDKAKIRYEKRPEGIVAIQKFGDEEIASPIDTADAPRLSSAQAWIEQHNRAKQELEAAKAAHDPLAAEIQKMDEQRAKLAIDTLQANRREALELDYMEKAAKAGVPVYEPQWKRAIAAARKDPRLVDIYTKAGLYDQGSPLADDVERVSLPETGKLIGKMLDRRTDKGLQPGQGVLKPGTAATPLARPQPTLKDTILESLAADNTPATGKSAQALATESLGITDPDKWSVATNEQGTHDLSRDGQLVGTVDTRNNQIRLFPPTTWEQEAAQTAIANTNKDGLPVYYMGGGQPMRPQELRDYIQSGFDIAATTKDPVELETKLAAAGLSPDAIRRNVLDGRLSVQDGRMLSEKFHGIQQVDTTEAGTRKAFGEWLTKPENRTQAAMFQNGDAAQKADVVSSFFDQHASQAATGNLLPNREGLAAQREAMLKPYTEKGALGKVGDAAKNLFMPMIGIGAQAKALPFQEALHLFGAETEAGKLSNEEFSNWLKRSSGFLHRINTRNELDRPLGDLEAWMNKANPGDEVPQELADKIAAAAFDTYHQLTPDDAKDLNTTRDTFDVNKDPALRGIVQNYLQTANPSARASLLGMLTMDAKDRETQKKVMAYIEAPRTATAGEAQERAALAGVTLTPEKAGQVLAIGQQIEKADTPAKVQNLVKQAGGVMGLSNPADIKTALDLITRKTTTSPDSAFGLLKGGFVAGRQEIATEALTTAAEAVIGFLTAGAATPEILAERAARQGIVSGARAALRRTLTAGLNALSNESKLFAAARGRIGQARRALGADLTKQADEFAKLGIVQPKFGAPLTTSQKARNIAVAGVKAGAVAAQMEGLEEGFAAIGETDPNLDSLVQQIGMGAAGGMVLGPLFTGGGVAAQAWKNRGLEARMGDLKTKWAEDFNRNMAGVAGFKPMRPEDFDVAMGVMNTPEHAAARDEYVNALAELQAAAQEQAASPASRLREVQARLTEIEKQHGPRERPIGGIVANGMEALRIETAEEKRLLAEQAKLTDDPASIQGSKSPRLMAAEARIQKAGNDLAAASTFAFEAADELRQLPADQQPLYTGIAKAVSGAREFTEAEAKALIGLQGDNAVAFQQAMPTDVAGPPSSTRNAPNVTQTGPGRYTLPEGVNIAVPPQAVAQLAERAPSLTGALGRSQAVPQTQAQVAGGGTAPATNPAPAPAAKPTKNTKSTKTASPWATASEATPVDGLWQSQNGDIPVRIVGVMGVDPATGETFLASQDASGKITGLPAKEVMLVKASTPKAKKTPPAANTGAQTEPPAKQLTPKAHENIARQVIGTVAAKSAKLKKLIKESKQPSTMQSGGMWTGLDGTIVFHLPTLVQQLAGLDAKTAAQRVEAILDEEIRHSANLEAARRLYERGDTNPLNLPFEQWREAWYGDIWNNHFTDAMRQQVKDAYGDTLPKEDWMRAMEGLRMLDQLRATGSITESVLRHLEAVLQALREFLAAATPKIKAEIQAIQAILIEFGYEQGAVKPEKAKKKARQPKAKQPKANPPQPVIGIGSIVRSDAYRSEGDIRIESEQQPANKDHLSPWYRASTTGGRTFELEQRFITQVVPTSQAIPPATTQTTNEKEQTQAQGQRQEVLTPAPETAPEAQPGSPASDGAADGDAGDQALADAFKGLFSAPAPTLTQADPPKERRDAMMKAASVLVDVGVKTPLELAQRLEKLAPNGALRQYSRAFWRLMTGFDSTLEESPDWQAVYAELDRPMTQPMPNESLAEVDPATSATYTPAQREADRVRRIESEQRVLEASAKADQAQQRREELLPRLGTGWQLSGNTISKSGFGHWTEQERDEVRQRFREAGIRSNVSAPDGNSTRKSSFTIQTSDASKLAEEIFAAEQTIRESERQQKIADEEKKTSQELAQIDSVALQWMTSLFQREDFANAYNKVRLSDFVTGKTAKFTGMVNPRWLDGVQAANAVLEGGKVDFAALKEHFEKFKADNSSSSAKAEVPERGDTVTWTDGAGKEAVSMIDQITNNADGTPVAWVEWFGVKSIPLDQLTLKTKSSQRLNREHREAEAAAKAGIPTKEVTTPEPVKEKKPADNKALKEMKRFLLEKLDEAIAEAPDGRITPSAYSGRVVIEIPGDGTFTLVNEKKVLQEFAKRAKSFPTTTPSATYPKPTAIRPSSIPALNKAKLSKMDMVKVAGTFASTDETRMNIMQVVDVGDTLVATNGKYLFMAPFEGQGTAEDPMLYTAKGGQIGPQSKHEEDFGKYPDWKVVVPKDTQVLHTGIDTGRLWQILKQASAVFRDVNFQVKNGSGTFDDAAPYVDLLLNPDGSVAVVGEVSNDSGAASNLDRYEHNLQEGAQSIGRFDASLFMDILAAMRALGQEKVSLRSEADMNQGALVVSSPVADVILMRVRTQAATNAANVEVAQEAMTPAEETAAAPVEVSPQASGLRTQADTIHAGRSPAELLALAAPYEQQGPDYNRNIAESAARLRQSVERGDKFVQLNADELAVRLEKWAPEAQQATKVSNDTKPASPETPVNPSAERLRRIKNVIANAKLQPYQRSHFNGLATQNANSDFDTNAFIQRIEQESAANANRDDATTDIPDTAVQTTDDAQTFTQEQAVAELAKRGITLEQESTKTGKTVWRIKGKTFDVKDTLKALGAKWYNPAKAWSLFSNENPAQKIASALAGTSPPPTSGSSSENNAPSGGNADEDLRLKQLRERLDGTPDRRGTRGDAVASVNADTAALIRRGLKFGMPADVVEDQIEDIATITAAFEAEKPMFLLGNGAGTGKTFVLGGAIRELRSKGAGPFVYVTMNQDLIEQIKKDLADYGVSDVRFHTYSEASTKGIDVPKGAVLIFDEAHNVKNADSERGSKGQSMMGNAKFTIFASATPFENPVQAGYLAGTGIFNDVGGHVEWGKAYGAGVRKWKEMTPYGMVEKEALIWNGGKLEDGLAARQWFVRQGIMVTRPMRLPMEMVESQFSKKPVEQKWVDMHDRVNAAYDEAMQMFRDEDGNILDAKNNSQVAMHQVNTVKRILESAKVDHTIEEAQRILANGGNVVVFVETKADRWIGRYRASQFYEKNGPLYSYPEMRSMMDDWTHAAGVARAMNERTPPRPFSEAIMSIARSMHNAGIEYELPSVEQEIVERLGGKDAVAVYTGSVSNTAAFKDKEAFLAGKKKVIVATMAKGGTGLSLHDKVGNRPTFQLNINLPWVATGVDQVSGRVARYGLQSKAHINWLFAENIAFERMLANRVGRRMRDMGALVKGIDMKAARVLTEGFDFGSVADVKQDGGEVTAPEEDMFTVAERLERTRRQKGDQSAGFFETPFPLAALMTQMSGARGRMLEPSAGRGNLLRFAKDKAASVLAVELRPDNADYLRGQGINVENADFADWDASGQTFDTIHMNPPFERKAGFGWQDMAHLRKAHSLLAPGGRLVAIIGEGGFFRSDNQSREFREWLDENGAYVVKLPEGAFKNSNTNVRTRMIVMDQGAESGRTDLDLSDMDADSLRAIADAIPSREADAWTRLSDNDLPRLDPDMAEYTKWRLDVAEKAIPNGTLLEKAALALELANAISLENAKPDLATWQHSIVAMRVAGQLLTGERNDIISKAKARALTDEYSQWFMGGMFEGGSVSEAAFDANAAGRPIPQGFERKNGKIQPITSTPEPVETTGVSTPAKNADDVRDVMQEFRDGITQDDNAMSATFKTVEGFTSFQTVTRSTTESQLNDRLEVVYSKLGRSNDITEQARLFVDEWRKWKTPSSQVQPQNPVNEPASPVVSATPKPWYQNNLRTFKEQWRRKLALFAREYYELPYSKRNQTDSLKMSRVERFLQAESAKPFPETIEELAAAVDALPYAANERTDVTYLRNRFTSAEIESVKNMLTQLSLASEHGLGRNASAMDDIFTKEENRIFSSLLGSFVTAAQTAPPTVAPSAPEPAAEVVTTPPAEPSPPEASESKVKGFRRLLPDEIRGIKEIAMNRFGVDPDALQRIRDKVGSDLTPSQAADVAVEFVQQARERGEMALIGDALADQPEWAYRDAWKAINEATPEAALEEARASVASPADSGLASAPRYQSPAGLAETARQARGLNSPASLASIIQKAYAGVKRGSSSVMVPIRAVFMVAKAAHPEMTMPDFLAAVKAADERGDLALEAANSTQEQQSHEPFVVPSMSGPGIRMVWTKDEGLASAPRAGSNGPMASEQGAAQANEPSPGGLSEAEVGEQVRKLRYQQKDLKRQADDADKDADKISDSPEEVWKQIQGRKRTPARPSWVRLADLQQHFPEHPLTLKAKEAELKRQEAQSYRDKARELAAQSDLLRKTNLTPLAYHTNEYGDVPIGVARAQPTLEHFPGKNIQATARAAGIDFRVGFAGFDNGRPVKDGIVVASENADTLRAALGKREERKAAANTPEAIARRQERERMSAIERRRVEEEERQQKLHRYERLALKLFPGMPEKDARSLARHASDPDYTGVLSNGEDMSEEDAMRKAVWAHIRHQHTGYDSMFGDGLQKEDNRPMVRRQIEEIYEEWKLPPQNDEAAEVSQGGFQKQESSPGGLSDWRQVQWIKVPRQLRKNWSTTEREHALLGVEFPKGWEINNFTDSKGGSVYYEFDTVTGKRIRVSIRDHAVSSFREQEFGNVDLVVRVPDARTRIKAKWSEMADSVTNAIWQWLRENPAEYRTDVPERSGSAPVSGMVSGAQETSPSSAAVNPESSRAAGGTLSSAPAPDPKAAAIKEAVATMPPMWREALELSMKGTPPEDIATRMNLSETAVGNILRTAQGRLRILLEAGEGKLKPALGVEDEKVKAAGGRPDLAMSGNAAFAAVDQRRRTPEEVTHGEMEALAQRLFATDAAAAENLVVRWMDSGTTVLSTEGMPDAIKAIVAEAQARSAAEMLMTAAAKLLVTEKALAGGNAIQMARLIDLYRNTGTEQARALNMRYDPHATPEERAAMYLSEALLTPPEAMRNEIRRNPANKERILAAWAAEAEKLKEQLKAEGYDIDATFRELAKEKELAEATIPEPVKPVLARAPKKTRQLVKALLQGLKPSEAIAAAGMTAKAAYAAYKAFRDTLNEAGNAAAKAMQDQLLRSAPAGDFASNLGLPNLTEEQWLEAIKADKPLRTTTETEKLKDQRERKKAGGEFDLKDPVAAKRVITKISAAKSTAFDKISEYWRASILSGPQTHVVNVVSGVTFGLYESTFKKLATATQADIARMFGLKPDAASLSDIPSMLSAVLPSIKQAFADGLRAWKEDSRVFDAYAMQVLDDQGGVFKEQSHAAIKGKKGAIIRSPFRLMGMADEFVKSFFTRIEVAAQARQIARNENLTGEAFRLRIAELMEPGSLAWERALGGAKRITFQNEEVSVNGAPIKLGGPLASGSRAIDAIDGAANLIKRTKKGDFGGLLRGLSHFIFPFVDTPTNIFKMGVQMSPVGGLLSVIDAVRYYNLRRKGNNEQAQKIYNAARAFDDLANQIVAWGFILALSELVKPGDDDEETPWITGTLPWRTTAPGEREIAYRVAPPQSIRIGGQWISYKRLDPFASALAFTVDAIKEFGSGRPIDETWGNVGLNMMRNMQDKTFLQGVSDLFNAINDPERFGTKWAVNLATGFVPNLIRQPVRTADPLIRESDIPNDMGLWDALARRVGYSVLPQSAMPAIDVWGREQAKNTGTGGPNTDWVLRLFSPADMKDADGVDYLDVALLRYNMAHDKPFGVAAPSREIQKTINGKPVRVSLDDAEYDDMARKAGKAARAAIGDRFKGRDLTENDVELIKDIISRSQGVYRDAAFTSAFQKRGLAATSK